MSDFLSAHDGHVALLQALLLMGSLALASRPILETWRDLGSRAHLLFGALGVLGVLVPILVFPTERFVPLGHEASYYECFTGQRSPSNSSGWHPFVTHPLLRWTYWALGGLVGRASGPGPLLLLNAVSTGVSVFLFSWLARVLSGKTAVGGVAGLLLALHPVHAFWGAAIFHTAIPYALAIGCILLALLAWQEGCARLLLAAAACGITMAALRVEWSILAPALGFLLAALGRAWGRHPACLTLRFWWPALGLAVFGAVLVFGVGGTLTQQGGYHSPAGYLETIGRQVLFREIFDPWDHGILLLAALLGGMSWGMKPGVGWRGPLGLFGLVLITHVGLATFNDYGYRHALVPGTGLVLAASFIAPGLRASFGAFRAGTAALLCAALAASFLTLSEARERYYASEEQFLASTPEFKLGQELDPQELEDGSCYLITDNERLWSLSRKRLAEGVGTDAMVGSHFNLMDPGEAVTHFRSHGGCVLWLYDKSQYRWDSLGTRVRAAKMRYWFSWGLEGHVRFSDGLNAVVYRLTEPPWGVTSDRPIPETEFLLPGPADSNSESELELPP